MKKKTKRACLSQLRMLAWKEIEKAFGGAECIQVICGEDRAAACCVWPDGIREYMEVEYADLECSDSQHGRAMREVRRTV